MMSESQRKMKAIVKDPEHCSRVVSSLQSFNSQQSYTDLCFVCAHGLKVYAHKLLVCSVSTQLKELLLQLPDNLSKITIHIPDIDSRILQLIINLLYEGNVRVSRRDYDKFKDIMHLLGIVLEPPNKNNNSGTCEDPPPPPLTPIAPTPQMLYMPNSSSSQGGVQYVLAPSSIMQGSLMSSGVQPSLSPSSSVAQPLVIPASTAQVQAGNQMVQLVQSQGGQMVPVGSGQMVQTVQPVGSQIYQRVNSPVVISDSQMGQPTVNQILPDNNQMIQQTATQMVNGGAQLVVQNNRHAIVNNSMTQVNLEDQAEERGSESSMSFPQGDATFSMRKRTRPHPISLSSTTHQLNLSSVRDRTITRKRTGPVVTGVHSLASVPGNRSRPSVMSRTEPVSYHHHINRAGQLVRMSQRHAN